MELRRKLEAHGPRLIHTVRGRGYVLGDAAGGASREPDHAPVGLFVLAGLAVVLRRLLGRAVRHGRRAPRPAGRGPVGRGAARPGRGVEVHPTEVQWEPLERKLILGSSARPGSSPLDSPRRSRPADRPLGQPRRRADRPEDGPWTFAAWAVHAGRFEPEAAAPHRFDAPAAALPANRTAVRSAFTLTVAASHARPRATPADRRRVDRRVARRLAGRGLGGAGRLPTGLAAGRGDGRIGDALGDDPAHRLAVAASGDELEDLGRAFNGLLGRLHAAHDRQRRFTGDAAHQFGRRSPRSSGSSKLRCGGSGRPTSTAASSASCARRADGMRQVVEGLLFLARSSARPRRSNSRGSSSPTGSPTGGTPGPGTSGSATSPGTSPPARLPCMPTLGCSPRHSTT